MYASPSFRQPAANAPLVERQAFLRKVGGLTFLGLVGSFLVALSGAFALFSFAGSVPLLLNRWVQFAVIMGSFGIVQMPAANMVQSEGSTRYLGFGLGVFFQGVAMSYLLFVAALVGMNTLGNPFQLILEATGVTLLMALGMVAWLVTGPKELSMVRGALAMLSLPMLGLMVISFVFPITGTFGLIFTGLFVVVSAAGVLYQLNGVMYEYDTRQPVPAAYAVTIGLLVLYWNVLSLLMRSRD